MTIFKYNDDVLKLAGYKPIPVRKWSWRKQPIKEYYKPFGQKDFPRFHLREMDNNWDLHIDQHRRHGMFFKWLNGYNGITTNSKTIEDELIKLQIFQHAWKIEEHKKQIIILRKKLV